MNPNFVGGVEISTLVAVILLGMVTVQIYVYYLNFPHDSWIIKSLIAVVWMSETAHVAAICYGLYRITITRYGHLELPIPLEMCTAAILGNAIHPLVQAIFTARIYQLGQTRQNRLITAISWAMSGFILGATVLLSLKVFTATSLEEFEDQWDWLILGLLGCTAAVDFLIAAYIWLALLILTTGLYSNSLLSLLNGRLHLGHQTEAPFMISLSIFRQTGNSRSQVEFSVVSSHSPSEASINPGHPEFQFDQSFTRWVFGHVDTCSITTLLLGS
ncbi:hypothetical protein C8R43DRAFT_1118105 [Mycena crocata]|nr:hypothetical protein C8R43DRAFT_1118105 [Mycena crocata]